MRIAVLTGGGDCPGLNAAIRAVVRKASLAGDGITGICDGWKGFIEGKTKPLTVEMTSGILAAGGTILGSSRVNPLNVPDGIKTCLRFFHGRKFDALIAVGGEGTIKVASALFQGGMPIVCIPKTIDNDLFGTDYTIGFHTAVQVATDAIDRLQTTAESHHRIMIVEVMGRHTGWIASYAGIAGGADAVLIPEQATDIRELCRIIERRERHGKDFSIFVVAEDARIRLEGKKTLKTPLHHDEYGDVKLGGIGELLARELRKRTDSEVRVTVLGHIQRGGTPTAFDRILATRLGVYAVELVHRKKFGLIVGLRGNRLETIPLFDAAKERKQVDREIIEVCRIFE